MSSSAHVGIRTHVTDTHAHACVRTHIYTNAHIHACMHTQTHSLININLFKVCIAFSAETGTEVYSEKG